MKKFIMLSLILQLFVTAGYGHDINYQKIVLHEWTVKNNVRVKASLLFIKNNDVYLQTENSAIVHFPVSEFSSGDKEIIRHFSDRVEKLNDGHGWIKIKQVAKPAVVSKPGLVFSLILIALVLTGVYLRGGKHRMRYMMLFTFVSATSLFYGFTLRPAMLSNSITDPLSVDSAFTPFKPNVVTSWDNNYFYVESHGIPTTHGMMTGITSWQQQVPIPQCYILPNAWQIPLNPAIAATPIPVDSIHFTRGAIAVAVNGIPIFNYHTNTGVDAYLDGQLDQWGGHCGRADDYHYHIAPLHLYNFTSSTMPVAYALDGFSVYGSNEPDGSAMLPLDSNNGHFGTNGIYHYHGVPVAPYMIGRMAGVVTEDTTHQIIPQPHASPVRPGQTPLQGAVITNCTPNGNNGYTLEYTLGGNTDSIVYNWTSGGVYTFNFYTAAGNNTSVYNGFVPCQLPVSAGDVKRDDAYLSVYPNPAHHVINVRLENSIQPSRVKSMIVFNSKGEEVINEPQFIENIKTDLLPGGIYYLVIKTEQRVLTHKIVLQ